MSNKTSDKNVATEDDVRIVKAFIDYAQEVIDDMEYERPVDVTVYQKDLTSMQNILAELEQKDKRIQELEKQLQKYYNGELYTAKQLKNLENNQRKYFINKQEVIDKLERHKFAYEEFSKEYNNKHYEDDEVRARDFYMIVAEDRIVQVLQELLEGGRK